ncbi:MAG: NAD(P)H-hydrate dehydratase [Deltaproteobacteria bacterium]|jgi:NAD(P)H-hydrate epimerase|nr:NAD(P)H-hydrate dehydratase [Deltaproteobacteria bacterium]
MTGTPPPTGLPPRPVFVASPEESRELDRRGIRDLGIPGIVLMENAARSVVAHVLEMWPDLGFRRTRVAVLGGSGQNGGDGWAVARILHSMGHDVRAHALLPAGEDPPGDAGVNFRTMEAMGIRAARICSDLDPLPDWERTDLLVEAVFGTGLTRPLTGQAARVLGSVPRRPRNLRVASVDLPSGISGEDGRALGPAPEADLTVALAAYKPGHFMGDAMKLCGELRLGDIGLPPPPEGGFAPRGRLLDRAEARLLAPHRPDWAHKGTFGHAVVCGGSPGKSGALALAATGALRAGAGLITAACPAGLAPMMDLRLAAPMCLALPETSYGYLSGNGAARLAEFLLTLDPARRALGLGPGLGTGPEPQALVAGTVRALPDLNIVLDADALASPAALFDAIRGAGGESRAVITPHPGEAARILGCTVPEVERGRLEAARARAAVSRATVVLKGRHTIVMSQDGGHYYVNMGGGPALAAGGSGDLLTGLITGFMARGMPPREAAALAVWVHAEAGDLASRASGPQGISPMEFQLYLPLALSGLSGFVPDPAVPRLGGPGV